LLSNTEVNKVGPTITETKFFVNNIEGKKPNADEEVIVTTKLSNANGIDHASLYFSTGIYGKFSKSSMYDDGLHNDGAANDGTFGGILPGNPAGTWVRYYIEAVAGNTAKTAAYDPVGAEHDVYVYQVNYNQGSTDVVINELMASNLTGPQDEAGEFEDWIELYNKSEASIDLSGYHLSDNITNFKKFKIPSNTVIEGKSYLIIWADEKQSQGDLHANFKLSADGEWLGFSDANGTILDSVSFPKQTDDLSFSRIPNGTGTFVIKNHTFGKNNETTATSNILSRGNALTLQPNPADKFLIIKNNTNQAQFIRIKNINGQTVSETWLISSLQIDTHEFPSGLYIVQTGNEISKIVIMH
ncbi:MAG: lamin tail domain-containing protein, partial [Saprospiraceae bacterium]|nr:lamin tail domain-containing protein [Saprospiraceae bacterium]